MFYTDDRIKLIESMRKIHLPEKYLSIRKKQKYFLSEMNKIFKKHNSSVKIVINPLADQIPFDQKSLDYLYTLFGMYLIFPERTKLHQTT